MTAMTTVPLLFDILINPMRAAQRIKAAPSSLPPLLMLIAVEIPGGFIYRTEVAAKNQNILSTFPWLGNPLVLGLLALAAVLAFSIVGIGTTHVVCHVFGGTAPFRPLWTFWLTLTVWTALANLLPVPAIGWLAGLWSIALQVVILKVLYDFSWPKSIGMYILSVAAVLIVFAIVGFHVLALINSKR